jgi:hypothetical protein
MLIFEGNAAVLPFGVRRDVATTAGPPGPIGDASEASVTVIGPARYRAVYTLAQGDIVNLGGGEYRCEFDAPTAKGAYTAWIRVMGPAPGYEVLTMRLGFSVALDGSQY